MNSKHTPILNQVQSFSRNTTAAVAGSFLGALIPAITFHVAHEQIRTATMWEQWYLLVIVVAGLAFSAPKVATWAATAFQSRWAGIAFTIILEGTLTFTNAWTTYAALAFLVAINAMSAAHNLVTNEKAAKPVRKTQKAVKARKVTVLPGEKLSRLEVA